MPNTLPKTFYLYAAVASIAATLIMAYTPMLYGTGAPTTALDWLMPVLAGLTLMVGGSIGARKEYAQRMA